MNVVELHAVASERIPTPREMIQFIESQGWSVTVREGRGSLKAPKADAVAVGLAKLMSREPYRTNIIAELEGRASPDVGTEPHGGILVGAPTAGEFTPHR